VGKTKKKQCQLSIMLEESAKPLYLGLGLLTRKQWIISQHVEFTDLSHLMQTAELAGRPLLVSKVARYRQAGPLSLGGISLVNLAIPPGALPFVRSISFRQWKGFGAWDAFNGCGLCAILRVSLPSTSIGVVSSIACDSGYTISGMPI
jgi:hypothetical protein